MSNLPNKKSSISDDDILFIGIPGVKSNLTLNLEWPVPPGTSLPGMDDEPVPRVEPAPVLTEYKIIIVDPDDLGNIKNPSHAFERRRAELRSFLEQGGLLVCILRKAKPVMCFRSSELVMNYDFIVQGWHNFTEPRGVSIKKFDVTNEGRESPFSDILKKIQQVTVYIDKINKFWGMRTTSNFMPVNIRPLAISTSEEPIAFEAVPMKKTSEDAVELGRKGIPLVPTRRAIGREVHEEMQGKMVFLPDYVLQNVNLLVECAKQELMRMGTAGFVPANWTKHYTFPKKEDFVSEIDTLNSQLKRITEKLQEKERELADLELIRDVLLNGQGKLLEQVVKKVFNELGVSFQVGPEGRDDLILKDEKDKTILVCEVKGVKSSAAEDHGTRLNKWCDRVYEEEKLLPKGLLIVNAWREKDPLKREVPFPNQMIEEYCKPKKFCLMTTFQLFNIWCLFKVGKWKENILDKIMKTVEFQGYDDPNANRIAE